MTREEECMKSYDDEYIMKDYKDYNEVAIEKTKEKPKEIFKEEFNKKTPKSPKGAFEDDPAYEENSNSKKGGTSIDYTKSTTTKDWTSSKTTKVKKKSPVKKIISIVIIIGIFSFIASNDEIKNQIADMLNIPIQNSEDYLLVKSNRKYLREEDLIDYSKEELGYIRNEIFARHGFIFGSNKYKSYFEGQPWYTPNPNFKGNYDELNKYEEYNVDLILRLENR